MKKTTSWHVPLVSPVLYSERTSFVGSLFRKWNRALFSRRDCSVPDWTDADAPKCLQSSFVFVATDTSIVLPRTFSSPLSFPPPPFSYRSYSFLSCDLTVLSLDFSTSIFYSGTSLVPFLLAFRRTCAELSGCLRNRTGERRRKSWNRSGLHENKRGKAHENSECTCFEAYASKAGDKQKRGKELVLRIGSQSRNTFARDIDRLCLFFPRNECIFSYILRENKKHAGIQVNSHSYNRTFLKL